MIPQYGAGEKVKIFCATGHILPLNSSLFPLPLFPLLLALAPHTNSYLLLLSSAGCDSRLSFSLHSLVFVTTFNLVKPKFTSVLEKREEGGGREKKYHLQI